MPLDRVSGQSFDALAGRAPTRRGVAVFWVATLVGLLYCLTNAPPAIGQEVIERPEWLIGDWWEFQGSRNNYRLTVVGKEGAQYVLVSTLPDVPATSAEGMIKFHSDVDGWITKRVDVNGKTTDYGDKYEWVKFPMAIGKRWSFSVISKSTKGDTHRYDYDCLADRWETIEIKGKKVRALRISISSRGDRSTNKFTHTGWYSPDAKRLVRLVSDYPNGPTIQITAWNVQSSSPGIVAAAKAATPSPMPERTGSTSESKGASEERTLSDRVKFARFTKDPPPAGTRMQSDLSNAPSVQRQFDAERDSRVVFLYGVFHQYKRLNVQVHWFEPSGALVDKFSNRDDATTADSSWRYYMSVLNTERMKGKPGVWRVQLWMDDALAGEYSFELITRALPQASSASLTADQPDVRVGDRWIRSDGVFEVVRMEGNKIEYALGSGRRWHGLVSGELERISERGATMIEYQPPLPVLRWPLKVGSRWRYEGRFDNRLLGTSGPFENAYEVVAFEEVVTPAGTFEAFKIVSRTATYWYSPTAKTIVRALFSSQTVFRDFELVVFDPAAIRPAKEVAASQRPEAKIGGKLSAVDFRPYYGQSWAVIIGINRYQSPMVPRLNFAVADARAVADALPGLGFSKEKTIVLENNQATKAAIERALYGSIGQMGKEDRLFVFFAGHGEEQTIRGGKEGYLLPFDADPGNLPLTAIPMTEVAQIGRRLPTKHVLFALDNCFSGYATKRGAGASVEGALLTVLTNEPVVQILTAGTQGQSAVEEGGHGIFTKHLLKGLEGWADPDGGGLTALKLATFIQERVIRESFGKQTPQYGKLEGEGEFLFRPPRR